LLLEASVAFPPSDIRVTDVRQEQRLFAQRSVPFSTFRAFYPDSSVGIVMGYGLDGRGSIPGRVKTISILFSVQTGSEAGSYPTGTGDCFLGFKEAGA
jgi:hypothetical protein